MIDLCKLFGVEEGEEFKLGTHVEPYRIYNDSLQCFDTILERWRESVVTFNYTVSSKITKLPKKKEFTDDELAIMRSIEINYKWIVRNRNGRLFLHKDKPEKYINGAWDSRSWCGMQVFNHLFNSIKWEDEEPVCIDDYVERGVE